MGTACSSSWVSVNTLRVDHTPGKGGSQRLLLLASLFRSAPPKTRTLLLHGLLPAPEVRQAKWAELTFCSSVQVPLHLLLAAHRRQHLLQLPVALAASCLAGALAGLLPGRPAAPAADALLLARVAVLVLVLLLVLVTQVTHHAVQVDHRLTDTGRRPGAQRSGPFHSYALRLHPVQQVPLHLRVAAQHLAVRREEVLPWEAGRG